MDKENFEQLMVGADVLDPDQSRWLQDGMEVQVSLHEGTPVGVQLPKSVVLAVTEADAVVKGQTASSSYKPAIVEGGIRVMVPPHIGVGTTPRDQHRGRQLHGTRQGLIAVLPLPARRSQNVTAPSRQTCRPRRPRPPRSWAASAPGRPSASRWRSARPPSR